MAKERSPIKLQFADGALSHTHPKTGKQLKDSPSLEINNGDYDRTFLAKDQPFECDEDEAAMLLRSGKFVLVPEPETAAVETGAAEETKAAPRPRARGKIGGAPASAD